VLLTACQAPNRQNANLLHYHTISKLAQCRYRVRVNGAWLSTRHGLVARAAILYHRQLVIKPGIGLGSGIVGGWFLVGGWGCFGCRYLLELTDLCGGEQAPLAGGEVFELDRANRYTL